MNEKEAGQVTSDVLIADALIRVKALENLLISKGVFTKEEFTEQVKDITEVLTLSILEKSKVSGDLNKIIEGFK